MIMDVIEYVKLRDSLTSAEDLILHLPDDLLDEDYDEYEDQDGEDGDYSEDYQWE